MNVLASWAYAVGWVPKGVPIERPIQGVPCHVQHALLALAEAQGMPITWTETPAGMHAQWRSRRWTRAWEKDDFAYLAALHPLSSDLDGVIERLLLPIVERSAPPPKRFAVEDESSWTLDGRSVGMDLASVLTQPASMDRPDQWNTELAAMVGVTRLWALAWLGKLAPILDQQVEQLVVSVRGDSPLPVVALLDTLELLEATRKLYGLEVVVPTLVVQAPELSSQSSRAVNAYFGDPATSARGARFGSTTFADVDAPHIAIGDFFDLDPVEELVHWSADQILQDARTTALTAGRSLSVDYEVKDTSHEVLQFFFQRFTPHPHIRDYQYDALARILRSESLLVLLPTGYGKSAIYQTAALMQPGVALIISPYVALIHDQVQHLERDGVRAVGALSGRQSSQEKNAVMQSLRNGELRLLYVTPERLVQSNFRKELAELILQRRFSLIAVDEVHSASEWGHDFRPAYSLIKSLRRFMQDRGLGDIPIVGFTATASPIVRADVLRMLDIPRDRVVQSTSSDRPELSYSVHRVDGRGGSTARLNALSEVVTRLPERVLGAEDGLLGRDDDGFYTSGAIVFAPFASANSEAFYANKAPGVGHFLAKEVFGEGDVASHAASAPSLCPKCASPRVKQRYGTYSCDDCGWKGKKKDLARPAAWDKHLVDVQEAFLEDRLPVLVSTKGFGVGIDKSNIRLIVHHVMSGSLEGYYQEAGRAGRDHRHAHVAMVTVPPAPACSQEHLDGGKFYSLRPDETLRLPCLETNAKGYPILKCPYGLTELCDVAQQAYLINSNFPGAQSELRVLLQAFDQAQEGIIRAKYSDADLFRPALTRLQSLTVIDSYSEDFGRGGVEFRVKLASQWSWKAACEDVASSLGELESMTGGRGTAAARVRSEASRAGSQRDFVERIGAIMIDVIYTVVRASRLISLYNLQRYASLQDGECRRIFLRRAFDLNPISEDYNCGFCDTCVPSLDFDRDRAFVPEERTREQVLNEDLNRVLVSVGIEEMKAFAREAMPEYASATRGRTEYLLEQRPNDLAVLFLLAISLGAEGKHDPASQIARRAVEVLARENAAMDEVVEYVFALREWIPDIARDVFGEVGTAFDAPRHRAKLLEQIQERDPDLANTLRTSFEVRQVRRVREAQGALPLLSRLRSDMTSLLSTPTETQSVGQPREREAL